MAASTSSPRLWTRALAAIALLPILLTSSCKILSATANAPSNVANMLGGKNKHEPLPPNIVQAGVMRYADTFASRITEATLDFAEKAGTPEARIQGMTWAIGQSTSAYTIAAGPNANVALLDLIVLVTLGRMIHEEYWGPKVWGEADLPMVEAFTEMEKEAWLTAKHVLNQTQEDAVRKVLKDWRENNPDMGITAFVRLPAFREILAAGKGSDANLATNLGDLLAVDPLTAMEPAVRELEQTRMFAERAMFYAQRAPIILSTQVELLGLKLMRIPEIHSALEDSERISLAAESLSKTAAILPEAVSAEREAAIKQISEELTLQREGIVADLEKVQEPAGKLLTDARGTLEAGAAMSTALQGAIGTLDDFIAGFKEPEPPPGTPPPPEEPPGKPFDIVEYGDAATQVATAAHELNGLVTTLNSSLPEVQRIADEAAQRGTLVVDHAYARGLQLGGILIGAVALAVLAVRFISARVLAPKAPPAG